MSTRNLGGGGGRVLGSRRSLSPAPTAFPPRNSSLLSPSASSASVNSSTSLSQQSIEGQDLSSKISVGQNDERNLASAAAASRLVCPICNEEMVGSIQYSAIPELICGR